MRRKIKIKIFLGFLLMIGVLIVAGAISIDEFIRLSTSVNDLMEDNYHSVESSRRMTDALEREDSGLLLILHGKSDEGSRIIMAADTSFQRAFDGASNNITEPGEELFISEIRTKYHTFFRLCMTAMASDTMSDKLFWYFEVAQVAFIEAKTAVEALASMNETILHDDASLINMRAQRAIMPGIISIIVALIFSLLLNFFITRYFVRPLIKLMKTVRNQKPDELAFNAHIDSEDELKDLETEIQKMILRYHNQRRDAH